MSICRIVVDVQHRQDGQRFVVGAIDCTPEQMGAAVAAIASAASPKPMAATITLDVQTAGTFTSPVDNRGPLGKSARCG